MAVKPSHPRPPAFIDHPLMILALSWRNWLRGIDAACYQIGSRLSRLNGASYLLVNDLAQVRKIMQDDVKDFPKHPYVYWILNPLVGNAIFSANGDEWARQRRLIDNAFQSSELNGRDQDMMEATDEMIDRLKCMAPGADGAVHLDIEKVMTWLTADVISRTILSTPLGEGDTSKIFAAFKRYQRKARIVYALRFLMPRYTKTAHILRKDAAIIREWIQHQIDQRLDLAGSEHAAHSSRRLDVLDCLCLAVDPVTQTQFTRTELLDQICFLFLAGHETSASSLTSASWLLALDQESQHRLRMEAQAHDDLSSVQSILQGMRFGIAVFKEALRLYPPISFFNRVSVAADQELPCTKNRYASVSDFQRSSEHLNADDHPKVRCPLGSLVIISPWIIQRHERHWLKPNEFVPERFMRDAAVQENRQSIKDAWLPFGQGPRICPGAGFALQENLIVLSRLLKSFRLEIDPGRTPQWTASLTLRTAKGVHLKLYPLAEGV